MSFKEIAKDLIDQIPEEKLVFIVPLLQGAAIPEVEIVDPDGEDLEMIRKAKEENADINDENQTVKIGKENPGEIAQGH